MPFIPIASQNPEIHLGLWEITETKDKLLKHLSLTEKETAEYQLITHPHQALHWLSSRVCLKKILRSPSSLVKEKDFLELLKSEEGRPFLVGKELNVSLSHSHSFSAVAVSLRKIGIDIEKIQKRSQGIEKKFLNDEELTHYLACRSRRTPTEQTGLSSSTEFLLTLYWSAKEALYKAFGKYGVLFKEHIRVGKIIANKEGGKFHAVIHHKNQKYEYQVYYSLHSGYVLTYVCLL